MMPVLNGVFSTSSVSIWLFIRRFLFHTLLLLASFLILVSISPYINRLLLAWTGNFLYWSLLAGRDHKIETYGSILGCISICMFCVVIFFWLPARVRQRKQRIVAVRVSVGVTFALVFLILCGSLLIERYLGFLDGNDLGAYKKSVVYQGQVYHLAVRARDDEIHRGAYVIELAQCDPSGWFCHVVAEKTLYNTYPKSAELFFYIPDPDDVTVDMRLDTAASQLIISYGSYRTEDGEFSYPLSQVP